jgi:4-hydroxy-3-methylbut-2-enyl diphosphate reductase IspH
MRPPTVPLAAPRPFRAGVERATETVEHASGQRGRPVYVRGRPRRVVGNGKGPIVVRGEVARTVPDEAMNRDWT